MSEFGISDFFELFQYEGGNQGGGGDGSNGNSGGGDDGYEGGNQGGGGDSGGGDIDVNVDVPSVQDFIDNFIPELLTRLVEDLKNQVFTPDVLRNPIKAGIDGFFQGLATGIQDTFESFFRALIMPLVETPAPKGNTVTGPLEIAFRSASNDPWGPLISNLYFEGIVGLALGLQFITLAAVGLRYKSMDPVVRKQVGRRVVMSFFAIFLWLPVASLATQFFDIIARQIVFSGSAYDVDEVVTTLYSITEIGVASPGLLAILVIVGLYVYLKAIFIALVRWIMVILLTLCMPLVAAFWPLEVWPFNRFAGLAKQVAGAYPGALAGGIPAAVLFRISFETEAWGLPDALTAFVALATIYLAAKAQKEMIVRSSRTAVRVSEETLSGAKQSVTKPAKVGAAVGAGGATVGAGAVAGKGGSMAVGSGLSALSSAAKGRIGRTAYNAMNLQRGLTQADFSRGQGTPDDSATPINEQTTVVTSNGSVTDRATDVDDARFEQTQTVGNRFEQTKTTGNRSGKTTVAEPNTESQDTVTYWDVLDDETTISDDTKVYSPGDSPDNTSSEGQGPDSASVNDDDDGDAPATGDGSNLEDLFETDDDDQGEAGSPSTDELGNAADLFGLDDESESESTDEDSSPKDLFATDSDVLGPDAYRPRNDSPDT